MQFQYFLWNILKSCINKTLFKMINYGSEGYKIMEKLRDR